MEEMMERDYAKIKSEFREKKKRWGNREEELGAEIDLLHVIGMNIIQFEEKANSTTLKNACEKALGAFNVEEDILNEYKVLDSVLSEFEGTKKCMKENINRIKVDISMLKYLEEAFKLEIFDENSSLVYYFLNEIKNFDCSYHINTSIENFRAFPLVEKIFHIERKDSKCLCDKITILSQVDAGLGLRKGNNMFVSLSHQGILAIFSKEGKNVVQFTDLNIAKQVEIEVENTSLVGFYDDKAIFLTLNKPLREAPVNDIFKNSDVSILKKVEGIEEVNPYTDVSLLNDTRLLYYTSRSRQLYFFDVDKRENKKIGDDKRIWSIASLTGINCGVEAVFHNFDDHYLYVFHKDLHIFGISKEKQERSLTTVFPPNNAPGNFRMAIFKFCDNLIKDNKKIKEGEGIKLENFYSIVRIYKDVFLMFNTSTKSWVICRIVVSGENNEKQSGRVIYTSGPSDIPIQTHVFIL